VAENARLTAFIDAQEAERHRIAQDLHDSVGQLISTVKLQVGNLEQTQTISPTSRAGIPNILRLIDAVTQEIRTISFNLLPASLGHFGLRAALKDLVEGVHQSSNLQVSFYENADTTTLNTKAKIYLYRIVQEAIRNIIQHAHATEVDIQIIDHEDTLLLEISDNGAGFDTQAAISKTGSSGLKNMIARVNTLEGKINIEAGSSGTSIFIYIPKKDATA
jgi:signal transduction histidine kinase